MRAIEQVFRWLLSGVIVYSVVTIVILAEDAYVQTITADFIVVGGGSAGCVLATRLAEHGFETLLITSGSNDTLNPLIRQQSLYGQLLRSGHLKHHLPLDPSPNLNDRILDLIVWNTLGGNSINAGGIVRLMKTDWNPFRNATGDATFHTDHMAKYYTRVENFTSDVPSVQTKNHGTQGPIKVKQNHDPGFDRVWKNVAKELKETFTDDLAGSIDYGFSFEPTIFTEGLRSWSGDAYLRPAVMKYRNLKVLTDATATHFNLNEKTKQIESVSFISACGFFVA
jgi:choline dehydrogenase